MAVIREANLLSQQRFDIPHIRGIESAVAGDFDVLAGRSWGGQQPLVVRGFQVTNIAAGTPATSLQLSTADSILFNSQADVSGTMLWVPPDRAVETLNPVTNPRVLGGWTPGGGSPTVNYVGLLLTRNADASTTDLVQFLDSETDQETPKQVPLARTIDYTIQIGTVPFSGQSDLIPIAKVSLDSAGHVSTVQDARPMVFRLAAGGDTPNPYSFFAGWTRREGLGVVDNTVFQGGDKQITSLKQWQDAVMTRIWETSGGEFWYSATADRNVELITYGSPLGNGEYFSWNLGTNTLTYQNLRLLFDNSTSYNADIGSGTAVLNPGDCLYVDADRTQFYSPAWLTATTYAVGDLVVNNSLAYECTASVGPTAGGPSGTGQSITDGGATWKYVGPGFAGALTPQAAHLATLGTGNPPGSRWILAWRRGAQIFTRGWRYPVGTTFQPATTSSLGEVELIRNSVTPLTPLVMTDGGGQIQALNNTDVGLLIKASATGTADLQRWLNNAGTPLLAVDNGGALNSPGSDFFLKMNGTVLAEASVTGGIQNFWKVKSPDASWSASVAATNGNSAGITGTNGTITGFFTVSGADSAAEFGTTSAHDALLVTSGTSRWKVDKTTGDLAAQGGNKTIHNVTDAASLATGTDAINVESSYKVARSIINLVINGGMDFWQRGTSIAVPQSLNIAFAADRWGGQRIGASSAATMTQQTDVPTTPGFNFTYALRCQRNVGNADTNFLTYTQEIDRQMLQWYAADLSVPLTLTFWAKKGANFSGTFNAQVQTGDAGGTNAFMGATGYGNQGTPLNASPALSTSWQQFSYAITNLATGLGQSPNQACVVFLHHPSGTAGANDWFEVTGVMLTPQTVVAPTTFIPAGGEPVAEFNLCQRYYEKSYEPEVAPGTGAALGALDTITTTELISNGQDWSLGSHPRFTVIKYQVPSKIDIWTTGGTHNQWSIGSLGATNSSATNATKRQFTVANNTGGATSSGTNAHAGGHWAADAEITA